MSAYSEPKTVYDELVSPNVAQDTNISPAAALNNDEDWKATGAKRIDKVLDPATGNWIVVERMDVPLPVPEDDAAKAHGKYAPFLEHPFLIRRKIDYNNGQPRIGSTVILFPQGPLQNIIKHTLKDFARLLGSSQPLKITPQPLLSCLPELRKHLTEGNEAPYTGSDAESAIFHLRDFLGFLEAEYAHAIHEAETLVSHGKITFDLLWAILKPLSILYTECSQASEPRAVRLLLISKQKNMDGSPYWRLDCEYTEVMEYSKPNRVEYGMATLRIDIEEFTGALSISEVDAYPIQYHPSVDEIMDTLAERGRKWMTLNGRHHCSYDGLAFDGRTEIELKARIMIDRYGYTEHNRNRKAQSAKKAVTRDQHSSGHSEGQDFFLSFLGRMQAAINIIEDQRRIAPPAKKALAPEQRSVATDEAQASLSATELLLASPILYGFSFEDNRWLAFKVKCVETIVWNEAVFDQLEIDGRKKNIIKSLINSHSRMPFDDFIRGKGLGLVINLAGPPGVGKTLTAEAASEHLRRPLYTIGGRDLAKDLNYMRATLNEVFSLAPLWNAIVLVDEADMFLEQRLNTDFERNSMVAVFLRQLEYFRGILILTTNRAKWFDKAVNSRIHLSLRFDKLTAVAKEKIWKSFLTNVEPSGRPAHNITDKEIHYLAQQDMDGRKIKNTLRLALALSDDDNRGVAFGDVEEVLKIVNEFDPNKADDVDWV